MPFFATTGNFAPSRRTRLSCWSEHTDDSLLSRIGDAAAKQRAIAAAVREVSCIVMVLKEDCKFESSFKENLLSEN